MLFGDVTYGKILASVGLFKRLELKCLLSYHVVPYTCVTAKAALIQQ